MALAPYPWLDEPFSRLMAMREKLPNAILIHGSSGAGTLDLARAFAASLLCESPRADGSPCQHCAGCRLVGSGTHPDYRIVVSEFIANELDLPYTPAENSSSKTKVSREVRIHQFRALNDFLTMAPHRGGRRVVLVYPADMVRAEAAASLLKSMEEPPEGLVYLLVADDIDAVLPTIRSRSRLLRVGLPGREEALSWLRTKKRIKDPEAALAMAGGAPLLAVKDSTGLSLSKKASEKLTELLLKGESLTADEIIRGYGAEMTPPAVALFLVRWGYDLVRARCGLPVRYFINEAEGIASAVEGVSSEALFEWNKEVSSMRAASEHPLSARQVWENIMLRYVSAMKRRA